MSFAAYYKLSANIFVASGFLAVAMTGTLGPIPSALFGSALCLSWFVDTVRLRRALHPWILRGAFLATLPAFYLDFRFLSHSLMVSALHLMVILAGLKLLILSTDRDHAHLFLLSFGCLLAAAVLTLNFAFFLCLLLFLISGVTSLILFEMKQSSKGAMKSGMIQPVVLPKHLSGSGLELFSGFPSRAMTAVSLALAASIIAAAVPLFFLLPRTSLGAYQRPSGRPRLISGFSETVKLGAIGTIKTSSALVMKVKVDAPGAQLPSGLKWRGIALDYFDGKSWSRGRSDRSRLPTQGGYFKLQASTQGPDVLVQMFFLEPVATDVVFGTSKVLAVSSDLGSLEHDACDNIYVLAPRKSATRYSVISDITRPGPEMAAAGPAPLPPEIQACCLQVPPEDARIAELGRKVTALAGTPYEKAKALESYLRTAYAYSLDLKGTPDSPDPLAMFLFEQRRGHCEYFATAMAIMLRQLGIPSRLVNGFRAGEHNRLSDHWTVRQSDAHSWVEVFFPAGGWVEFDPTPAEPVSPTPALIRGSASLLNALDFWWSNYVVNYDLRAQSSLVLAGRSSIQELQQAASELALDAGRSIGIWVDNLHPGQRIVSTPGLIVFSFVILCLTAALLFGPPHLLVRRVVRSLDRTRARRDRRTAVISFYAEALDILESRGFGRIRSQTPLELARDLASEPCGAALASLTTIYNRVRFGRVVQETDAAHAHELLRRLRQVSGLENPVPEPDGASFRNHTR